MVSAGISRILNGVMKYRKFFKEDMVKQLKIFQENPNPSALIVSCTDSRVLPSRFTQANIGDTFYIRNAGNIVPHAMNMAGAIGSPEPAVLEVACVINQVRDIVVCGHSDCKAMNCLHDMTKENILPSEQDGSQLRPWVSFHGQRSLELFEHIKDQRDKPLDFMSNSCVPSFRAFFDDNKFCSQDILSQVNTLQQMEHITTYKFLHKFLEAGEMQLHAMWFDINAGDVYYFSKKRERFVDVNEQSFDELLGEVTAS